MYAGREQQEGGALTSKQGDGWAGWASGKRVRAQVLPARCSCRTVTMPRTTPESLHTAPLCVQSNIHAIPSEQQDRLSWLHLHSATDRDIAWLWASSRHVLHCERVAGMQPDSSPWVLLVRRMRHDERYPLGF